ncbi:hypothetical protein [Nostoc sp. 'Peltigera malacea cyanobiont' DB3992]|uniref:hypothetical protein n=1 Tax=Nostoc sp. 'Peltigera malacea cyanobiont' DB3992 TaxID=1206980 RepID=UPI000C042367|nr:hypothetical protein [Nostoc sp. 'Peltigera malacea cyanobiont' DB3992]PHM11628.1 hypothetical protein CK516_01425 [Nostoc sp. 'Peltigera malacea cyanobiont' DB3992]
MNSLGVDKHKLSITLNPQMNQTETDIEKLLRLQAEIYKKLKEDLAPLKTKSQLEVLALGLALTKLATEVIELGKKDSLF